MSKINIKSGILKGRFAKVKYGKDKSCLMYCKPVTKYDLETKQWREVRPGETGKAFSIVKCNRAFGKKAADENSDFEYFLLLDGQRVENYSNTGKMSGKNGYSLGKYLPILEEFKGRVKVETIIVDNDGPLEQEAELVANRINQIKENDKCKKITVLGVSKCGCMSVAMLKYLTDDNLDKLDVLLYSAPFLGTVLASPVTLYKQIDEKIAGISNPLLNKIATQVQKIRPNSENKKIDITSSLDNNKLLNALKQMHWNIFSQSHMDYDISIIDGKGVPEEHQDRYDSNFLNNMFNEQTLEKLKKVKVTNITTTCSKDTLTNCAKELDSSGIMLYASDKLLMSEPSDGMVELASAKHIEEVCKERGIKIDSQTIVGGHHSASSSSRIIREILEPRLRAKDREREIGE